MTDTPLIQLVDVTKTYHLESGDFTALDHVSLDIMDNDFVAIMGPSGSGKSTMMNQLGILDVPTSGKLSISGRNVAEMSTLERTHMRRDTIGYIFQKFYLIPLLSAYENVEYPLILKYKKRDTTGRAHLLLEQVGIDRDMSAHRPTQLSGDNSSGWPSPVRSSTNRRSFSAMNRPGISTARPGTRSWTSSAACTRRERRSFS